MVMSSSAAQTVVTLEAFCDVHRDGDVRRGRPRPPNSQRTSVPSPSFLSDTDGTSTDPVAPPTVRSPRGVVRLSMLLAADRQDGDGDGEMTTPPLAPVLTTLALT